MKCCRIIPFLALLLVAQHAAADTPFKELSAAEREKVIRTTLFAVDNPQYVITAPEPEPETAQTWNRQQYQTQQRTGQRRASMQAQNLREPDPNQPAEPEPAIALDQNGSVRVRSGNAGIDRSVESYIQRKARSAKNTIYSFFR